MKWCFRGQKTAFFCHGLVTKHVFLLEELMNKKFLLILSGLYLLIMGPMLDPLPLIDEGVALAFFIKTLKDLLSERRERRAVPSAVEDKGGPIIDVD